MAAFALACGACSSGASANEPGMDPEPVIAFILFEHRDVLPVEPRVRASIAAPQILPAPVVRRSTRARDRVLGLIRRAELRYGLPLGLLDAVIAVESAYLPWQVSRAGAAGLAQLMPATAIELGVSDRFDPIQSINGGARYLRQQLDRFGSVSLALAAYNAGPGAVRRSRGIPRNGETPAYVSKVLRRWFEWRGTT